MLAHSHRRNTRTGPARDGCAAAAVAFPELDGIRLAILGLHTCLGDTVLRMHASGPMCHMSHGPEEPYFWPVIWIRGNGRHWHATAHPRRHRLAGVSAHTTGQRDTHMIAASQRGFRPANRLTRRGRLP